MISCCKNSHFSGLRYKLFSSSMSSTRCVRASCHAWCCSLVSLGLGFVWIAMSSMYTESHPCATYAWKMWFIIIWKVAGELVRLKNITSGSNSPSGVKKAAFHSSPSLIRMLLYSQRMLNFVNKVHPANRSTTCRINGDTFRFFFVHLLTGR